MKPLIQFLTHPLYNYDIQKVKILKVILPIFVIMDHMSQQGYSGIEFAPSLCKIAMFIFFAMSGFGLVKSYLKQETYINGFLQKSLTKLFTPYIITFIMFSIYRYLEGINQIALFKAVDLFSFIPTSWYIWTLSYFYIFFFIVFRFVKSSNFVKVFLVCLLVIGYCTIAPHLGISPWRYDKCPAFCVGALFGLFDKKIKLKFIRWHAILCIVLLFAIIKQPFAHRLDPLYFSAMFFLIMYVIGNIKDYRLVNFISSISLEMFIIQFIPIYITLNDW